LLFALLFGVISLLYATAGQAGGTAFLALMAFAPYRACAQHGGCSVLYVGLQPRKSRRLEKVRLLLLSSLPTALVGGFIVLDEHIYKATTGVVLLLAVAAMILRRDVPATP
jgi:hypothetical protein